MPEDPSRRRFLKSASTLSGAAYLRMLAPGVAAITQAACSARDEGSAFSVLSSDEAADFAAIAARIIPTTGTPGATEAGVIHFIDRAYNAEMSDQLAFAREQLDEFNAAVTDDGAGELRFADLDQAAQDAFLEERDSTPLFNMLWAMTVYGFFAMPKYGGNRNMAGWELIGFDGDHGSWQYPFGHYDAEVHAEAGDGE